MTDNRPYKHCLIFALILIVGLGLALALPWLANSQGLAAKIAAPSAAGPCWATFNDGATYYNTADASAVQAAVDGAAPGDVVKLAGKCEGVVAQGGTLQTVYISKDLTLEGGHTQNDWTLEPDPQLYTTTLNAKGGGRVVVISGTVDVTLDSLIITGGQYGWAAGIWANGEMTLKNSVVYSNTSPGNGGGVYVVLNHNPEFSNVTFSGNKAKRGAGIFINTGCRSIMTNVTFIGNMADWGGGLFDNTDNISRITNAAFIGNTGDRGGGIFNNTDTDSLFTNVLFSGNTAEDGAGMYNNPNKTAIVNATFSGNSATGRGGGMWSDGGETVVQNSVFWNNQAEGVTGTITATAVNINSNIITFTNSLVESSGGSAGWALDPSYVDGGGNIDTDPLFILNIDPSTAPTTTGNLRLQTGSPGIDAGDNSVVTGVLTDLDGEARIVDGNLDGTPTVDMGAYETPIYSYLPLINR